MQTSARCEKEPLCHCNQWLTAAIPELLTMRQSNTLVQQIVDLHLLITCCTSGVHNGHLVLQKGSLLILIQLFESMAVYGKFTSEVAPESLHPLLAVI